MWHCRSLVPMMESSDWASLIPISAESGIDTDRRWLQLSFDIEAGAALFMDKDRRSIAFLIMTCE